MNFEAFQILSKTQEMMSTIMTEIPRDQKRWFLKASNMNDQLKIIEQFAIDRPSHLTKHIQDYFHLEETIPITLSTNGKGNILLHELPLNKQTLTINFFKNFPVTIIAKPQNGNFWSHWSDGDTNAIKVIYPDTAKELTAIFK